MTEMLDRASVVRRRSEPERRRADPRRLRSWVPPRGSRPVLERVPAFAGCDRRQLWRIARWGEVIEVHPGETLVREDHTDYWFFVILSGTANTTHQGRLVETLHPGDHFGELAIVGFRPQTTTVTAVEPCVMFVLGRRYLLSLAAKDPSIRRVLFPQAEGRDYKTFVRELHAEGRRDWERLRPRYLSGRNFGAATVPGRGLSWGEALDVLSHQRTATRTQAPRIELPSVRRRSAVLPVCAAIVLAALVAVLYHPPAAVITPGRPIDVVGDISITGARVHRPTGRYLLTPVDIGRPSLAGLIFSRAIGRTVVSIRSKEDGPLDPAAAARLARAAFVNSHRQAIAIAEETLHIRTDGITIAIRDRGLIGPSAGLVYALAIVDMLGTTNLAAHRVIAATGELIAGGGVAPVGFISLKARAARWGDADIFLVPRTEVSDARLDGLSVIGVSNLAEAVRALQRR